MSRFLFIFFFLAIQAPSMGQVSLQDLQGSWTRVQTITYRYSQTNPLLNPDADEYTRSHRSNVLVRGDSIWYFEYPCFYTGKGTLSIAGNDSVYYDKSSRSAGKIEKFYDAFILRSREPVWQGPVQEIWRRDSFDLAIIDRLKKDSVDCGCLAGSFEMVTYINPVDAEGYELHYPIDLPLYLEIADRKAAEAMVRSKKISLVIGKETRSFKVSEVQWNENNGYESNFKAAYPRLVLEPGDWWKGEPFSMTYKAVKEKVPADQLKAIKKASSR